MVGPLKKVSDNQHYRLIIVMAIFVIITIYIASKLFKPKGMISAVKFQYKGGSTKKDDWYKWITPLAQAVGAQYGLPWQAMSAQTALETGYGSSSLLRKYNNFGGIKDTDGVNSTEPLSTKEFIDGKMVTIKDGFEIYPTPYDGLIAYAQFFHKNKRYANALRYPNDPLKFIAEVKKAGYATDPNYISKLKPMISMANEYAFTGIVDNELKLGSAGLDVEKLQRLLNVFCLFENLPLLRVDGSFGKKTQAFLHQRLKVTSITLPTANHAVITYLLLI